MNPAEPRPLCALCGDRIGVYEPIWHERLDGTRVRSGLMELGGSPLDGRIFHSGCLPGGEPID